MKTQLCFLLICLAGSAAAQNTGIGTVNPQGKLQINNNTGLRPSLLLADSASLSGGSIRWQNIGTGKWMSATAAATSAFSNGNALLISSDSLTVAIFTGGGNVGIRNATPAEALDVNGNINLTGTIKANGADGSAGQVLGKNGSGSLQWQTPVAAAAADENLATFTATTAGAVQIFTVPAGVTKITVEAWGGGGAGGSIVVSPLQGVMGGGGGGGGGYVKVFFAVVPGNTVSIVVGKGGSAAAAASASTITFDGITVSAEPGANAVSTAPLVGGLTSNGGRGGSVLINNASFRSYHFVKGADGDPPLYRVMIVDTNLYTNEYQWGRGGNAGNSVYTGGTGGQTVGLGLNYHYSQGSSGGIPGGGGGGDRGKISNGGDGLVVVRW
jgi:hypothetical protein